MGDILGRLLDGDDSPVNVQTAITTIQKQDEIIQKYARHANDCLLQKPNNGLYPHLYKCTCGLSAALAALRKLQE